MIKTERLWIKPLTITRPEHIAALNNKEHMRWSEQRRQSHDNESQEHYIRHHPGLVLDLLLLGTEPAWRSVGTMAIEIDRANLVADMGIMILPEYVNKGYGREAWYGVIKYTLANGIVKVEAGFHEKNDAMRNLCLKASMEYEGYKAQHFCNDDGTRSGMVMYGKHR